jgi:CYRIA/CYRIB Rac1 binding domain
MGKLLSLLARDNSDCCGPKSSYDIFLDFENAQPSETEAEVYNEVQEVLIKSDKILEEIQVYKVSFDTSLVVITALRSITNLILKGARQMLGDEVNERNQLA